MNWAPASHVNPCSERVCIRPPPRWTAPALPPQGLPVEARMQPPGQKCRPQLLRRGSQVRIPPTMLPMSSAIHPPRSWREAPGHSARIIAGEERWSVHFEDRLHQLSERRSDARGFLGRLLLPCFLLIPCHVPALVPSSTPWHSRKGLCFRQGILPDYATL